MAYLPEVECARIIKQTSLQKITENSVSDTTQYLKELDKVRTAGYAQTTGEVTPHSSTVAGPVFNSAGEIIAAIVVRGPESRITLELGAKVAPFVMNTAEQISEELGFGKRKPAAAE